METPLIPKTSEWTIARLLNWTTSYFKAHTIDSPRLTAEILLSHVLDLKRIELYLRFDQPLISSELADFKTLIKRRLLREPVAYIAGSKEFWSKDIVVTRDVLIPRPDTECLVETSLALLPENVNSESRRIIELGTGSGALIIALASERPGHVFYASDDSLKALEVAKTNARRHQLDNKIAFFAGNWLSSLSADKTRFDMIISNPPYIPTNKINNLAPEIYEYEPLAALDGGMDGLDSIKQIIHSAHHFLNKNGFLILEMGYDQKTAIQAIVNTCGYYEDITFTKDLGGNDRVVRMSKK